MGTDKLNLPPYITIRLLSESAHLDVSRTIASISRPQFTTSVGTESIPAAEQPLSPSPAEELLSVVPLNDSARHRVYRTPELRLAIFRLLEPRDLATLLRLEKEVTALVAELVYKGVDKTVAKGMSRQTVSIYTGSANQ